MSTKLSRYAEGILEATWILAVICVPLFFNVYSSRIFEPDKLTLLRSLALLALGAWAVKLIDQGGLSWGKLVPEDGTARAKWKVFLQTPFTLIVVLLVFVYAISTIFSVAPRTSFWGSYQRLQGTYTTISYLVIFAAMAANLRKRQQVERVITAMILSSLPVGLYGVLQRFQIDPVPWGGNTSTRVASNMGNSIFVAAYIIMIVPLTIGRIVDAFGTILKEEKYIFEHILRGTIYVFTLAIQMIVIYLSGSRGPLLGILAGGFFLFVLLSLYWKKRWLLIGVMGLAAIVGAGLILLNIPNGPLEEIKKTDRTLTRFGTIFQTESATNKVRVLIWEGAFEMSMPHKPLEFPDGSTDRFNFLRPFFGYGPESMYVAYNPFYPVELSHFESRNASPDRSHNETWDAIVITGLAGLLVYMALFTSVFYYGLRWLRMINSKRQVFLFFLLVLGMGIGSAVGFSLWQGVSFIGIGFPFGMMLGLIAYLTLVALFARYDAPQTAGERQRALILNMLLSAIMAHFVEIHFGIAIAATRTHFWVFTAMMLLVGFILPKYGEYDFDHAPAGQHEEPEEKSHQKRSRKAAQRAVRSVNRGLPNEVWIASLVIAIILITLGYDFISTASQARGPFAIIWNSFSKLPNKDLATSYGILGMMLTTWLASAVLFASEISRVNEGQPLWKIFLVVAGASFGIAILYMLFHASSLGNLGRFVSGVTVTPQMQSERLEGLLTQYYVFLFILAFIFAFFAPLDWPARGLGKNAIAPIAMPVIFVLVFFLVSFTNLRIIHADIAFKFAEPFTRGTSPRWAEAISLYKRANQLAPAEDHYYLFLGRGYLELARTVEDAAERDQWIEQADIDLRQAQKINPLNTDHTANLARLYRVWASFDETKKIERAEISSKFYERAVVLSPQNTTIWNEWAVVYLSLLNDRPRALEIMQKSLSIDPVYDGTHALLGEYYFQEARRTADDTQKEDYYSKAIYHYQQAFENTRYNRLANNNTTRYNYLVALASVYTEQNDLQSAVDTYIKVLTYTAAAQIWRVEDTIARLYAQLNQFDLAEQYANKALEDAPADQRDRVQQLIDYVKTQQSVPQP